MNDFRKNMHVAYKKKLADIILSFLKDFLEDTEEFEKDPVNFVAKWIDSNCLPMGDFSKEDAINRIKEWQE